MGRTEFVSCPPGIWTRVYQNPIPFAFIYIWLGGSTPSVNLSWRRYFEVPPFFTEGSGSISNGKNTWFLPPPALYNEFWVNPVAACAIRVT